MGDDCLACALATGRQPLPGGLIYRTDSWLVEHWVGPLGLGTLIVKPERHVTAVAELSHAEASEPGPLLQQTSWVASQLVEAEQIYNCLWSHAGASHAIGSADPRPSGHSHGVGTCEEMDGKRG